MNKSVEAIGLNFYHDESTQKLFFNMHELTQCKIDALRIKYPYFRLNFFV